jgi:hypothetical protein
MEYIYIIAIDCNNINCLNQKNVDINFLSGSDHRKPLRKKILTTET